MHERTTNLYQSEKGKKTHPSAEASNPQGMGSHRQWGGGCPEVSSPPSNPVPLEKALEQGAQVFLSGQKPKVDPRIRRLETENQKLKEALALQTQELMLLKKEMNLV